MVALFVCFDIINAWQHFGSICGRSNGNKVEIFW